RAELAFPLENRGQPPGAVARGVEESALALGIGHLLDRSTAELSGGELQRVALAAALAGDPALLVLDEPTSQLDPVAGDELIGVLRRLNEDRDTAILLAEHRLERCLAAADRVVALDQGRLGCDGPAILRAASLTIAPGERVALMGRNGAGKSTLLRHAAGLMQPTRGRISTGGRVALLLQNPTDYLVHETVGEEAAPEALRIAGL